MNEHEPTSAAPPTVREGGTGRHAAGAPPTVRDAPAPATVRDAPAPATVRDAPAPATVRDDATGSPVIDIRDAAASPTGRVGATEGGSGAPSTTRDEPPPRRHRLNLPAALEGDYEVERVLPGGGEADVLLARHRSSGDQVVVRWYRSSAPLKEGVLRTLRDADPSHVVRILGWGSDADGGWELQEYIPGGSLADVLTTDPAPWPAPRVLAVIRNLTAALEHAHALGLVHRDVKPANLLVRSHSPLRLVLADFGLTDTLSETIRAGRTSARTEAYAAPEASAGARGEGLDWWPVGMIAVQLLTGRHPYQSPEGAWYDPHLIAYHQRTDEISVDEITDPRWAQLCRGLLTRTPDRRWTGTQIRTWLDGGNPAVHRAGVESRPGGPGHTAQAWPFRGTAYTDPVALAEAFQLHWQDGVRILAGRQAESPAFLGLRDWLQDSGLSEAARVVDRSGPAERRLAQLIRILAPDLPARVAGHDVSRTGLHHLVGRAFSHPAAATLLDVLLRHGVLSACDGMSGCDGYAALDDTWRRSVETFDRHLPPDAQAALPPDARRLWFARLLLAALTGQEGEVLRAEALTAAHDGDALAQNWFARMVAHARSNRDPALDALVAATAPHAAAMTAQEKARREAELAAHAAAERARRRATADRISAWLVLPLVVLSAAPVLGLVAATGAIYCTYRASRVRRVGCWSIGGCVLAVIMAIESTSSLGQL